MLVLSRVVGEDLILGDGLVTVRIIDIRGDKARIAIAAPRSLSVHRREVFDTIVREHGKRPLATCQDVLHIQPDKPVMTLEMPSQAALRDALCDGFVQFMPNSQLAEWRQPAA